MTIKDCIDIVDNIKPNQYTIRDKVLWLSFIDQTIINDVLKTHEGYDGRYDLFEGYSEDKLSVALIVASPYDRLYTEYLKMKIDGENGETARYNNSSAMFNKYYSEFRKYYNKTHLPISIMGDKQQKLPKKVTVGLSDAEYENLKRELYAMLTEDVDEVISHDKLYDIVTEYAQNNVEMLKGKAGKDGLDGKDGKDGVGNLIDNIEDAESAGSVQSADGSGVSLGDFCFAFGDNVIMGCRGFYIQAIDFTNKKIYLGNTKLSGLPTVGAGSIDESVDLSGYAVGDKFSIINGINYSLCGTIVSIENNVIGYTWEDPRVMNGFSQDTGIDGHTFCVPSKPTVGAVSFITTVSGFGRDLKGAANYCFLGGRNLLAAGAYSALFGRNNTANYGSFVAGMNNDAGEAFAGVTLGHENKSKYQYTNIIGRGLEAAAMYQVLRGKFNLPDATLAEIFGGGADANNRWNIRTLDWNGNGWYKGTLRIGGTGFSDGKEVATVDSILRGNLIGAYAFYGRTDLSEPVFLGVTDIGASAFSNCSSLTSAILPDAKNIGDSAFYNCQNLASVNIYSAISIGKGAFQNCKSLTSVRCPDVTYITPNAFNGCSALAEIDFSKATLINSSAFYACASLTDAVFPEVTAVAGSAFSHCGNLKKADFSKVDSINVAAFYNCRNLTALILRGSSVASLGSTNVFLGTPIESGTGYIYVPSSLVDSYKSATNWSVFAGQIRAIEDYPDIVGG